MGLYHPVLWLYHPVLWVYTTRSYKYITRSYEHITRSYEFISPGSMSISPGPMSLYRLVLWVYITWSCKLVSPSPYIDNTSFSVRIWPSLYDLKAYKVGKTCSHCTLQNTLPMHAHQHALYTPSTTHHTTNLYIAYDMHSCKLVTNFHTNLSLSMC